MDQPACRTMVGLLALAHDRACEAELAEAIGSQLAVPIISMVASSWIDMLAGLSGSYIFRMTSCFWAKASSAANIARNNVRAAANPGSLRFISVHSVAEAHRPRHHQCAFPRDCVGTNPVATVMMLADRI